MNNGVFRLWIKKSDADPWGLLETFPWDGSYRRKKQWRAAMLNLAHDRQAGWMRNYPAFASAAFAIEEQDDPSEPPIHISGSQRPRKEREASFLHRASTYTYGMKVAIPGGQKRKEPPPKGKVMYYTPRPKPKPGGLKRRLPSDPTPGGLVRRIP